MRYYYEGALDGGLVTIDQVTRHLLRTLRQFLSSEEALFNLRLVLSELLINGYEHGNQSNMNKRVHLTLRMENGSIVLSVEDEGDGFCYDLEQCVDRNSCSGRGLRIVRELSQEVEIASNRVTATLEAPHVVL